ncbi:MAG: DUF2752 domain-containing protein [Bacteroidales bacterium]|nr:DUF2752 domain-containing protein [Bacteroidales bacterium]
MKNKFGSFFKEPYHIINLCFAGIIILIFIYSGIFSAEKDNHPIKSTCEILTGQPCESTGLSRSFSEIVRFKFESAKSYNKYGIKIFLFFLIQFFLRIISSVILQFKVLKQRQHIFIDSLLSVSLYIYCFWNLIV